MTGVVEFVDFHAFVRACACLERGADRATREREERSVVERGQQVGASRAGFTHSRARERGKARARPHPRHGPPARPTPVSVRGLPAGPGAAGERREREIKGGAHARMGRSCLSRAEENSARRRPPPPAPLARALGRRPDHARRPAPGSAPASLTRKQNSNTLSPGPRGPPGPPRPRVRAPARPALAPVPGGGRPGRSDGPGLPAGGHPGRPGGGRPGGAAGPAGGGDRRGVGGRRGRCCLGGRRLP